MEGASHDERFPPELRLRRSPDFQRVQRSGRRYTTSRLVVIYMGNGLVGPRFGLAVSRKVGNAVVRNRVKRWLRESIRRQHHGLTGMDVVFIARSSASTAGYATLADDVGRAIAHVRGSR